MEKSEDPEWMRKFDQHAYARDVRERREKIAQVIKETMKGDRK